MCITAARARAQALADVPMINAILVLDAEGGRLAVKYAPGAGLSTKDAQVRAPARVRPPCARAARSALRRLARVPHR